MKKLILVLGLVMASLATRAANYTSVSFLRGTNLIMYTGTSATTFLNTDVYNTNRTYVNMLGSTLIPNGTNSTTGALYPSFEKPVQTWADLNGNAVTNIAIYVQGAEGNTFTNTIALTFAKSADNGNNYPTDDTQSLFTFTYDPLNSGIITNVPTSFLVGAGYVRLYKIVTAANPAGTSSVTLKQVRLSGYTP